MNRRFAIAVFVFAASITCAAQAESFRAGVTINDQATVEETGLRTYPGATPVQKKKGGDSEAANVEFAFGGYGLKVVAAKLRSTDSTDNVAAFYRKELARFGAVLDCGAADAPRTKDKNSKTLTCEKDKPREGGMLYKVGTKADQHVVEIRPKEGATEIALAHVRVQIPE